MFITASGNLSAANSLSSQQREEREQTASLQTEVVLTIGQTLGPERTKKTPFISCLL